MEHGECIIQADFLEHQGRTLFYVLLDPVGKSAEHSLLFLPPFAEEMNMSRRVVACQARSMAAAGYRVMLLDPTGCGDAGGNFADASWDKWLEDAAVAMDLLLEKGDAPITLWGLRLGALLASDLARARNDVHSLLFWQPVLNGEQQVDQFLRLKTAATALGASVQFDRKLLWQQLREGHGLEIAGYELSSPLALALSKTRLSDLVPSCPVSWLEISTAGNAGLGPASQNVVSHWSDAGVALDARSVAGDPFWRSIDADANLQLEHTTLEMLSAI